jgi:GTPase SAR1 family protein
MAKVYISSTYLDLKECRRKVSLLLRKLGHEDVAMEYYVAEDQRPVEKCLADVASSDLYIGIFAFRYGWIPKQNNPEELSITEMEYRQAVKAHKDCLILLLNEDVVWPPRFVDRNHRIEDFRDELASHHTASYFNSSEDIAAVISPAIYNWSAKHGHIPAGVVFPDFDLEAYTETLKKHYQRLDLDALTPPQKEEYLQLQLRSIFIEQNVRENPPPVELPKELLIKLQGENEFDSKGLIDNLTIEDVQRAREQYIRNPRFFEGVLTGSRSKTQFYIGKQIGFEDLPQGLTLDDIRRAKNAYYEKPQRPVLDVLIEIRNKCIVILGDPGSGKSTLVRYILLSLLDTTGDKKLRSVFEGYLPILLELRSYSSLYKDGICNTFLEFLGYLSKTEGWHLSEEGIHNYLKNDGRAVVLFDGLDEIFDPQYRERVAHHIAGFASDYPRVHIIVTSRILGYQRKVLLNGGFAHFTLQDLDKSQVQEFVKKWYALALNDHSGEAEARYQRIIRLYKESISIRQLAGNPMLLTIMAIIGKHQELPRERWKLYEHAANVLIQHWEVNKYLKDLDVFADFIDEEDKKELLRRLAYIMQGAIDGLAGNYIHRDQLQAEFESYMMQRYGQSPDRAKLIATKMIEQLRTRNFILSRYGANLYGFVHRAFLEYFCSTAFVYKFEKTREISLEEMKQDIFGRHWEEQSWHEVLRLLCCMIGEKFAGEIIKYLIVNINKMWPRKFRTHAPWNIALAVQCLSEIRNLNMIMEPAEQLLSIVCILFQLYSEVGSIHYSQDDNSFYVDDTGVLFVTESSGKMSNWNEVRNYDAEAFLENQIVKPSEAIGASWPGQIRLADWLNHLIPFTGKLSFARLLGIFVGTVGKGREEIRNQILNFANDEVNGSRVLAAYAIAAGWHENSEMVSILRNFAVNDSDDNVRRAAIWANAEVLRDNPQTKLLLFQWATSGTHGDVRHQAALALTQHFRDDPQIVSAFAVWSTNELRLSVCGLAASILSQYFRDDPQTKPILTEWATRGEHSNIRRAGVWALAEYFQDDPETVAILSDRAVNDESPAADALSDKYYVRDVAIEALYRYWPKHERTLSILRDRSQKDPTEWVRDKARRFADDLSLTLHLN